MIKILSGINCMIDILSNSYRSNTSTHTTRDKRGCDSQGVTDYADTIHDGCTHISLFNILDKTLDPHDERSGIPNGLKDLPVSVNLQDGIPATERIWRKSLLFSRQRVDSVPSCDVRVVESSAIVQVSERTGSLEFLAVIAVTVGDGRGLNSKAAVVPRAERIIVVLLNDGAVPDNGTDTAEMVGNMIIDHESGAIFEDSATPESNALEDIAAVVDERAEVPVAISALRDTGLGAVGEIGIVCFGSTADCSRDAGRQSKQVVGKRDPATSIGGQISVCIIRIGSRADGRQSVAGVGV